MIQGGDGDLLQPFAMVIVEVMEHGRGGSLTGAVQGTLARYLNAKRIGSHG